MSALSNSCITNLLGSFPEAQQSSRVAGKLARFGAIYVFVPVQYPQTDRVMFLLVLLLVNDEPDSRLFYWSEMLFNMLRERHSKTIII